MLDIREFRACSVEKDSFGHAQFQELEVNIDMHLEPIFFGEEPVLDEVPYFKEVQTFEL
jgi:hypothetical protein